MCVLSVIYISLHAAWKAMATAVGFFDIQILPQTGLACHSRAPLSPSHQSPPTPFLHSSTLHLPLRQYVGLAGIRAHDLPA